MSENVISFNSGRSFAEIEKDRERAEQVHKEHVEASASAHKQSMLDLLDQLKVRVETGELDGLVVAGRNPNNGAFLSSAVFDQNTRVDTYLAYGGILSAMNADMIDLANAGPHMNSDGTFFALGSDDNWEED